MVYINRKHNGHSATLLTCKNTAEASRKIHELYLDNLVCPCFFKEELYISNKPCKNKQLY